MRPSTVTSTPRPAVKPRLGVLQPPAADLAPQVDFCWALGGGPTGPAFQEFLPDSGVHLVVRVSASTARIALMGPATEKASVQLAPGADYFGVRFRTGQAPRLADVRASELTNGHVDLAGIGGMSVDAVAEHLRALRDMPSRQCFIEALVRRAGPPLVRDPRCRRAAILLEAHGGRLRVDDLAAELGLHARSLERLFLAELGIPPKRLARLVRLRQVLGALRSGAHRTLADVAHACGYADQPHLIKDFKDLTGRLPAERDAFLTRGLAQADTRVVHRYRR